jgi:hypothetical protein
VYAGKRGGPVAELAIRRMSPNNIRLTVLLPALLYAGGCLHVGRDNAADNAVIAKHLPAHDRSASDRVRPLAWLIAGYIPDMAAFGVGAHGRQGRRARHKGSPPHLNT